eukprot:452580_1
MSNDHSSINYQKEYQIALLIGCLLVILMFTRITYLVLRKIMFNKHEKATRERNEYFWMLIFAIASWISIIIRLTLEFLFATNFIFQFSLNNADKHCSIYGKVRYCLFSKCWLFTELLFVEIIANAFRKPKHLACSSKHIYLARILICIETLINDICVIKFGHFYGEEIHDSTNFYICDVNVISTWQVAVIVIINWLTWIIIGIVFLIKVYNFTHQCTVDNITSIHTLQKVERVIGILIRYGILMFIMYTAFAIIIYFDTYWLSVLFLNDIIQGLCIFMMFKFGTRKYNYVCGKTTKYWQDVWMNKRTQQIREDTKMTNPLKNQMRNQLCVQNSSHSSHTGSMLSMGTNSRLSMASLPPIEEDEENSTDQSANVSIYEPKKSICSNE